MKINKLTLVALFGAIVAASLVGCNSEPAAGDKTATAPAADAGTKAADAGTKAADAAAGAADKMKAGADKMKEGADKMKEGADKMGSAPATTPPAGAGK